MLRVLEYIVFFVVLVLLQVFLFNNLNLSTYIYPLVYIAFIILLPMEMRPVLVVLLGFVMGITMDFLGSASGLHTIATVASAYSRGFLLRIFVGKGTVEDEGIPTPANIGAGKFIRYVVSFVFLHCFIYFTIEAFSFSHFHITLLRILISTILTTALIFFSHMLLPSSRNSSRQ